MRKILLLTLLIAATSFMLASIPTKYFIGEREVSESSYNSVPDSIRNKSFLSNFNNDTLVVKIMDLPYTHYLDTIQQSGEVIIKRHSPERIDLFNDLLANQSQKAVKLRVGDSVEFKLSLLNLQSDTVNIDFNKWEKCYFISYWATWCGNCLLELEPDNIPEWIKQFADNRDFEFIPICIDSTPSELKQFFESGKDKESIYLSDITLIDIDRESNSYFAKSGNLPLNIVIGKNGVIKFIKIGRIHGKEEIAELKEAIISGLDCPTITQ